MRNIKSLLALSLLFVIGCAAAEAQISSRASDTFPESNLACTQTQPILHIHLHVPQAIAERARLKAHLASLLEQSLYDDEKGIVNIPREKEIRKLADKLRSQKE